MTKRHTAKHFSAQAPAPHIVVYGMESPIPVSWCFWIVPNTGYEYLD